MELIECGWERFYRTIFGDRLIDAFDSVETDDRHHTEAITWHWEARLALLRGERPPDDYFVYFPTWARGNMKTTTGRAMLITDALVTFAHGQRGYALIPGGTKPKIKSTAMSIEKALHNPSIVKYCPHLSKVEQNIYGRSRGWTGSYIATRAGYVFHFIGLDEGVAGANLDDVRPTFIMPDDIDTRDQSPVIAENRFEIFTSEILPTRQQNTLVYWPQNIINRFSVRYRIEKQHAIVLANRKPTSPVPAVRGLMTERRTDKLGRIRDIVTAGRCTWRGWDLQRVQDEIDTYGLDAFMRECQHDVERTEKGQILHAWNDAIHVISMSEFASRFGTRGMPKSWPKDWVNDWARTKTKYHANVAFWRTVSPQNSPLPGMTFIFHPMSFVEDSTPEDVATRVVSCLEKGPIGVLSADGRRILRDSRVEGKTWEELRKEELVRADALSHTRTELERIQYERSVISDVLPPYVEAALKAHNVIGGVNSHERDDIRRIYATVFGLGCRGVNPGKFGGTEQTNRDMTIDYTTPHAFRPEQMGYTRWYVVVPDDTDKPPVTVETIINGRPMVIDVYPPHPFTDAINPEALHDDMLFRYQMPNWRTRPAKVTEAGEIIDNPEKANDDFGNCLQMLAVGGALDNTPLTVEEEYRMLLPESFELKEGEVMTIQKQQEREFQEWSALTKLQDKYGPDVSIEPQGSYLEDEDLDW